jgi:hypothetical protein
MSHLEGMLMQEVMEVMTVVVGSMALELLQLGELPMILVTELLSSMWEGLEGWRMSS